LEWLCWLSSNVHIAYAQIWRPQRFLDERADPGPLNAGGMRNVRAFYAEIESRVQGGWAAGGRYSVVDPFLLVFYRWGERIGLSMTNHPSWSRHAGRMLERPAVRHAMATEGIGLT
jgi:glutathione S-transferase